MIAVSIRRPSFTTRKCSLDEQCLLMRSHGGNALFASAIERFLAAGYRQGKLPEMDEEFVILPCNAEMNLRK